MTGHALYLALSALHSGVQRLAETEPDIDIDPFTDLPAEAHAVEEAIVKICRAAREAESLAEAAKKMAQQTAGRAARFEWQSDQYRGVAFAALDALGKRKIVAPDLTVSIRDGRPSVVITDETKLADEYVRVTRTPDKAAIGEALRQGVVVDGAELANGMPTLSIRGS